MTNLIHKQPSARLPRPLVLLPTCLRELDDQGFHVLAKRYADAVRLAGCVPLAVPDANVNDLDALLAGVDGVLLTGSPSNVHPDRYGHRVACAPCFDPARDALNLSLIPRVLAQGIPLMGICRGLQEVNVALGGTLHQSVHTVPGFSDHRGAQGQAGASLAQRYAPAHPVSLCAEGFLSPLLGVSSLMVNSVHGQGIDQLAPGLRVEAHAPDGLVEAFVLPDALGFNVCVQWHPEWHAADDPHAMRLLRAFGAACAEYRAARSG